MRKIVLRFLFPDISPESQAGKYISLNFLSNILGLSWASTSSGLCAVRELQKLNEEDCKRRGVTKKRAPHIALNFLSNILGLSWASTSSGLCAVRELQKLNEEDCKRRGVTKKRAPHIASTAMCTFMIINVSSLQLLPMNMIAYRAQYGSVNPAAVVGPGIVATAVSTGVAVVFCKIMCTFMIINVSSLQLLPMNMIAYRAQYGSVNPAAVVGPGIVATAVSTGVAVVFCKIIGERKNDDI